MYLNAISGAIIILSSFIVLESAIEYSGIIKEFKVFEFSKKRFLKLGPFIMLQLMWLIFGAYISIGLMIGLSRTSNTEVIISNAFLLGGIFIYIVIRIQKEMLRYVENGNVESIAALVSAIEVRDKYTKGHSQHVSNLLEAYYNILSDKEKEGLNVRKLKVTGLLHDIGKLGIKEVILNKQGMLDEQEYVEITKHPMIGNTILGSTTHLTDVAKWIYYHHERVDGKGYYNKKRNEIPIESRILSVADTYSALVTDRVYRKGTSHEQAIEILKTLKGTQLDEEIVDKFIEIKIEEFEKCRGNVTVVK
ncbi:MAG: hypothetical protein A2Y24_07755 [Clostridiales bacterium GWE2_32_10]|nr:MAG: hypothetical protein A2Y24_07755 [Clostridiales bacterium GWE2_32_10]HBY21107.1 hypothetical protein [Clostridiales bacterium]